MPSAGLCHCTRGVCTPGALHIKLDHHTPVWHELDVPIVDPEGIDAVAQGQEGPAQPGETQQGHCTASHDTGMEAPPQSNAGQEGVSLGYGLICTESRVRSNLYRV